MKKKKIMARLEPLCPVLMHISGRVHVYFFRKDTQSYLLACIAPQSTRFRGQRIVIIIIMIIHKMGRIIDVCNGIS
jgi:hypothetical protein